MENFAFHNPTEIIFGKGKVDEVGKKAAEFGKKVLLVYGQGSIKEIGLYDKVMKNLKKANLKVYELSGIKPNPRLSSVIEGIKLCEKHSIDLILAVGGGSTIDASKAISVGYYHEGDLWEMVREDGEFNRSLPVGVILTLAATGSEMNANAVITNEKTNEKLAIHESVYPSFSILDPVNTFSVPRSQTVYGIVDIAAHVFEQYFSHTEETPLVDRWAEGILTTLKKMSERVLVDPEDYQARANIMLCGTMALNGLIGMGKSEDWASHAIEHEVSAIYDIPHGAGLAIIFPNWMEYVVDAGYNKFAIYADKVFGIEENMSEKEKALTGIEKTRKWFDDMGAPSSLADFDIGPENLETMAEKATRNGAIGHYKKLQKEDVLAILEKSLD